MTKLIPAQDIKAMVGQVVGTS
ncbi:MAG: hypothetical protein RIS85_2793, partial [Pseudomonadota bacterium]